MAIKLAIVDDAPFIREVLRHIFSNTEIEVVAEAQDGEEAIEAVKRAQPHVVLMDIVMPRKSGIEATQEILKIMPEVKIIACSTVDQNSMVMRALDAGCCNYITKPFTADEVLKAVRSAASGKAKEAGV
jgi:two-component system, chemotaxis family, chemotaxis protein CheY